MLLDVALISPPYTTLTYSAPSWLPPISWQPGQRIAIPLGNSYRVGIILTVRSAQELTRDIPTEAQLATEKTSQFVLKNALWPLETVPLLSSTYLEMARQLSLRHMVSVGRILGNLLPAGLRTTAVKIRFLDTTQTKDLRIQQIAQCSQEELHLLGTLWENGSYIIIEANVDALDQELYAILKDPPWSIRPAAKKQLAVAEYLYEQGATSKRKLLAHFGPGVGAVLGTLAERNIVIAHSATADVAYAQMAQKETEALSLTEPFIQSNIQDAYLPHYQLTEAQERVVNGLQKALEQGEAATHLLFGITGSGKTAVYLELARQSLQQGRSVLLLAPEVALVYKLWKDTEQALPGAVSYLFHGYLSTAAKEATFRAVARESRPCIVIGTRSALFLPLLSLGLIVLDEEHDASFKQDEGLIYHAKEVAWFRAGQENAVLLLGSATPDVKTFYAAQEGSIALHALSERVGGGQLPAIELIPLSLGSATSDLLTEQSKQALVDTVSKGEQAVILLNRRGYAPQMYCLGCGKVAKCPHCDIGLAYHKARERLLCHYCGYTVSFPSTCSDCKSLHFLPMGEGTEKIAETLTALLPPGANILRLDRDSTRRSGSMEHILTRFAQKEASVLVGTQMLSKGHHFPHVTLAIIADADLGLNLPDYRAAERTFQLLLQSSGRAGRGEKSGQVLIQTRDMQHYCWEYVKQADYAGFYTYEMALREKRKYPPYIRLALVRMSYPVTHTTGEGEVMQLGKQLRFAAKEYGIQVLGPAPAPLPTLQGRKRYHCLLKATQWHDIRKLFSCIASQKKHRDMRISLDLDPVSLL